MFVSEGESEAKLERINHSAYLSKGLRTLERANGSLFVFGVSFKDNDKHIMDIIVQSSITTLYVSIYGDIDSTDNKELFANIQKIIDQRNHLVETMKKRNRLSAIYYDAISAKVWG